MEKTEKTDKILRNTNLSIDKATHYYYLYYSILTSFSSRDEKREIKRDTSPPPYIAHNVKSHTGGGSTIITTIQTFRQLVTSISSRPTHALIPLIDVPSFRLWAQTFGFLRRIATEIILRGQLNRISLYYF